jgi:hypothetical protein
MASIRYSTAGSMRIYDNYLNNTVAKQNHKKSRNIFFYLSATLRLAQWESMVITSTKH